jgi:hypothetical protein
MIGGGGLDDEAAGGAAPSSNPLASTHARNALPHLRGHVPFDLAARRLIERPDRPRP